MTNLSWQAVGTVFSASPLLTSFEFIPEVTRLVKREYEVPINEDGDDMTQMLIMTEHIRNIFK